MLLRGLVSLYLYIRVFSGPQLKDIESISVPRLFIFNNFGVFGAGHHIIKIKKRFNEERNNGTKNEDEMRLRATPD
jgi:hypothetical protein